MIGKTQSKGTAPLNLGTILILHYTALYYTTVHNTIQGSKLAVVR